MAHFALKCTYNNGGEGDFVGFVGTCSKEVIRWNIESGRVWCNNCDCRSYYDGNFRGKPPETPCYESQMFREWSFEAGETSEGKPLHINEIEEGSIAILTTIFPGEKEENRRIIGTFYINSYESPIDEPTRFWADPNFSIRLPLDEAKELFFWNYYKNQSGGTKWGSGLFRYMEAPQVRKILEDLKETIRGEDDQRKIDEILGIRFKGVPTGQAFSFSNTVPKERSKRVFTARKYGAGGEGAAHKDLKEWIAKNPSFLGLSKVKDTTIEYPFLSGDVVDILFEGEDGVFHVIEIETNIPLPGCHQIIKYSVLKRVEEGLPLQSPEVVPYIVAWDFDYQSKAFCEKYGIKMLRKKL